MAGDENERPEHLWQERAPREKVLLGAVIENFGRGAPTQHRVRDLSTTGVRIDRAGTLRPGATVVITVGSLEAVGATVVWVRDDLAGLKFAQPVDVASARSKAFVKPGGQQPKDSAPGAPKAGWATRIDDAYRRDRD